MSNVRGLDVRKFEVMKSDIGYSELFSWVKRKDILRNVSEGERHQNPGQNQNIRMANESFENVATYKYLWTALKNENDIHDEIKSRLNSGNACYYSVLLSSFLI
jgi:hypothetical protein